MGGCSFSGVNNFDEVFYYSLFNVDNKIMQVGNGMVQKTKGKELFLKLTVKIYAESEY